MLDIIISYCTSCIFVVETQLQRPNSRRFCVALDPTRFDDVWKGRKLWENFQSYPPQVGCLIGMFEGNPVVPSQVALDVGMLFLSLWPLDLPQLSGKASGFPILEGNGISWGHIFFKRKKHPVCEVWKKLALEKNALKVEDTCWFLGVFLANHQRVPLKAISPRRDAVDTGRFWNRGETGSHGVGGVSRTVRWVGKRCHGCCHHCVTKSS